MYFVLLKLGAQVVVAVGVTASGIAEVMMAVVAGVVVAVVGEAVVKVMGLVV